MGTAETSDSGDRFVNSVLEMLVLRDFESLKETVETASQHLCFSGSPNGGLAWRHTLCVCSVQVVVIP